MADTAVNFNVQQVTATRSPVSTVTVDNFPQGTLEYYFTMGGVNQWLPTKSYFKVDAEIQGYGALANVTPTVSQNIALADNWAGNMFNQVNCKIGEQDVSVITQFTGQAAALKKKMCKSYASRHSMGEGTSNDLVSQASRTYRNSYGAPSDLGDGSTQYILKGCTNALIPTATVGFAVAGTGILTGVNTDFLGAAADEKNDTKILVGDILVLGGAKYNVTVVTNATSITVSPANTAIVGTTPIYYFIRQNLQSISMGKNAITSLYVPPCGLFDWNGYLGQGSYRIVLTPNASYQSCVADTKNPLWNAAVDGYKLVIKDIKLYIWTAKKEAIEGPMSLNLLEMSVLPKAYANSTSIQYVVPASTKMITVFAQSILAGSSTLFPPSSFKALPLLANIATKGRAGELSLQTIQLTYASIVKPSTQFNSEWLTTSSGIQVDAATVQTNRMVQRYFDTFNEFGSSGSSAGVLTIDEFLQSPFYHYSFARDVTDRSTELTVNLTYGNLAVDTNIMVVCWYDRTVNYTVAQGQVVAVSARDV